MASLSCSAPARCIEMEKTLTPSDLRKEAQALISTGQMPSLDTLLTVIAEARAKYAPLILAAQNEMLVIRLDEDRNDS